MHNLAKPHEKVSHLFLPAKVDVKLGAGMSNACCAVRQPCERLMTMEQKRYSGTSMQTTMRVMCLAGRLK